MQYVIKAYDGENMLEKHMQVRAAHLENLKTIDGKILCGGGLLDENGNMKGSVLVLEVDDKSKLDAYLESEPYIKSGVWQKIEVDPMNVVIVGGEKVGK
ncbi:MAG: hypothetical protein J6E46_00520 [Faecalicoccus sp.]|nr:hypothetical protein [Faecalicoccus sp.]